MSLSLFGQNNNYYWYKGTKIPLILVDNKKFILFQSDNSDSTLAVLKRNEWRVIKSDVDLTINTINPFKKSNPSEDHTWAIIEKDKVENPELFFSQFPEYMLYVSPFFTSPSGDLAGLSHLFYVRLHKEQDLIQLEEFAQLHEVEILGNNYFMPLWYTLACTKRSPGNAMEMANLFYESGKFCASEPDLMVSDLPFCVNDEYFSNQWNLNNTGQYDGTNGFDIRFCEVRGLTSGCSNIVVAVVDQGIELDHPDLTNMYPFSYDTESNTQPSQVLGPHGTACAGIIGASANNDLGVAGIASECQLMSVSNSLQGTLNSRQRRGDGINWAWHNGADVISNSWGSSVPNEIISEAIDSALTEGRNGLGCVIVFSSGNNNIDVSYPANYNPDIIAVGAMNQCGERKSPSSCDGEAWYRLEYNDYLGGSNYGSELDIVAPGVLIATTDRQGNEGYNPNVPIHTLNGGDKITADFIDQDFTVWFNGTSAATPHVAAVAALVLSVNPTLTQDQVRNIIESTTQKVRTDIYTYSTTPGRTNGTWNNQMGYGLLNAYEAVMAAIGGPIAGSYLVCSSGATFSLNDPPTGASISWNASPSRYFTVTSGSGSSFSTSWAGGFRSGEGTITATIIASCDTITLTKSVWAGKPAGVTAINLLPDDGVCRGYSYYYQVGVSDPYPLNVESYYWDLQPPGVIIGSNTGPSLRFYYPPNTTLGTYSIAVKTINSCGESFYHIENFDVIDCDRDKLLSLIIYPNPASEETQITINDDGISDHSMSERSSSYYVNIFDLQGSVVYSDKVTSNVFILSVSGLTNGTYSVVATDNKTIWQGALIVSH